jgi:hypothetical protein
MTSQPNYNENGLWGGKTVCADNHRINKEKNNGSNSYHAKATIEAFQSLLT